MSPKGKKDLTRIEDLDEFLHEPDAVETDFSEESEESDESPPDLPAFGEAEESFALTEETFATPDETFTTTDESATFSNDFDTTAFTTEAVESIPIESSSFESEGFNFSQEEIPEPTLKVVPPGPEEKEVLSEVISMADFNQVKDVPVPAAAPRITPDDMPYRPREDFAEVRSFAENAVLADVSAECNPAFSVIAHGIKFLEDSEDIMLVLRELKFPEEMTQQFHRQLERGSLLVPRISEFTAIYLCHRLRRFRLELQMGPSDLIHPPRSASEASMGLVSRRSLAQNQHHQFTFNDDQDAREILISTLGQLDGHIIERYLGVASEHAFLDSDQVEGEMSDAISSSYDELAQKLKAHALQAKANAVVGINYQLTPMPSENHSMGHYRYKLTCTGNLVRVTKPNPS